MPASTERLGVTAGGCALEGMLEAVGGAAVDGVAGDVATPGDGLAGGVATGRAVREADCSCTAAGCARLS